MAALHFTKDNFDTDVLGAKDTVLVDFWAPWCTPCMMLGPVIEEIAGELDGKAIVGKINIDEEQDLAQKFGVMSIPTILIFKAGKEVSRSVGVQPKPKLVQMIQNA